MIALVVAHLLGDALLLFIGYYWLGLADSSGALVFWSMLVLLLALLAALWLHGTALVFFRRRDAIVSAALIAARNLLPMLALSLVTIAVYGLLSYLDARFNHQAFLIGSYATMKTRKPVAPSSVLTGWHMIINVFRWLIIPALLLPVAASIAERGWPGISLSSLKRTRSVLYWVGVAAGVAAALYLPFRLIDWVPALTTFSAQFASFTSRFLAAYLLFAGGLLMLEYISAQTAPSRE